jgi:hypothetical protein
MFGRRGSRIVIATVPVLIGVAAFAPASLAQAVAVGPHQYFNGEVFSTTAAANQSVIEVACAGASDTGHPLADQYVEVTLIIPPVTTTAGYTGDDAVEIDAALNFTVGTLSANIPIATLTQYSVAASISTAITVPCSGSGVMAFTPYPDEGGTPSDVSVTFETSGVSPGA